MGHFYFPFFANLGQSKKRVIRGKSEEFLVLGVPWHHSKVNPATASELGPTNHFRKTTPLIAAPFCPFWKSQFDPQAQLQSNMHSQWRRHGGGGKRGNLPPPQPPIGHPVRSMQIRGDFRVLKKWGWVYRICSDVLHALTLRRTFFGLTITKNEGVVEVVERVTLVGPW